MVFSHAQISSLYFLAQERIVTVVFNQLSSLLLVKENWYDIMKSHGTRKPVLGVSDQVQHKPGCTDTENS